MRTLRERLDFIKFRDRTMRDLTARQQDSVDIMIAALEYETEAASAYKTPQWHHTVLWAGFAFLLGMLIGAGLMAG